MICVDNLQPVKNFVAKMTVGNKQPSNKKEKNTKGNTRSIPKWEIGKDQI